MPRPKVFEQVLYDWKIRLSKIVGEIVFKALLSGFSPKKFSA